MDSQQVTVSKGQSAGTVSRDSQQQTSVSQRVTNDIQQGTRTDDTSAKGAMTSGLVMTDLT